MEPGSNIDCAAVLAGIPVLSGLGCEEIGRIVAGTAEIQVARDAFVFHKGDPCDGFYCVVSGQIKLAFTSPRGEEKVVDIVGPGKTFGEALLFMDKPRVMSAQALDDACLLHLSKHSILAEMERGSVLARRMLADFSLRFHQLMTDLESHFLHSGTQRFVGYLLRELPGDAAEGEREIILPISKRLIASQLNLTQAHFSRILHGLFERGLIRVHGRRIRIPDVGQLRTQLAGA